MACAILECLYVWFLLVMVNSCGVNVIVGGTRGIGQSQQRLSECANGSRRWLEDTLRRLEQGAWPGEGEKSLWVVSGKLEPQTSVNNQGTIHFYEGEVGRSS